MATRIRSLPTRSRPIRTLAIESELRVARAEAQYLRTLLQRNADEQAVIVTRLAVALSDAYAQAERAA